MLHSRSRSLVALLALAAAAPTALAQTEAPPIEPQLVDVSSRIVAVTAYRGRAAVTRVADLDLQPGLYELRFSSLPQTIHPQTLQARTANGARVLSVDFEEIPATASQSSQVADLDARIEQLQLQIQRLGEQRGLIQAQEKFLDNLATRASSQAGQDGGTARLDLDQVRQQMTFIAEERAKLLESRRELDQQQRKTEKDLHVAQAQRDLIAGTSTVNRVATVTLAVPEPLQKPVELTYLVADAAWEPAYSVRASLDGSSAVIEYDAVLTQKTGEDWNDVALTLSTAQPQVAANPPALQPWFVDLRRADAPAAPAREAARFSAGAALGIEADKALGEFAADAQVGGGGPSITFQLPRTVTVKSNVQKQQRTRIAAIDGRPQFVHVALPAISEAVYIRGDLTNSSAYQILPGKASIFAGDDYIGPTTLGSVAPGAEFKLFFGIDPTVRASRQLVAKNTENTGLLSGGRRTSYDYRIALDNGAAKAIVVELWDRVPVSQTTEIQIDTVDLSQPLATDAKYLAEERPQGLLKWLVPIRAGATGNAAHIITYGVRINRARDVEMTPLPE